MTDKRKELLKEFTEKAAGCSVVYNITEGAILEAMDAHANYKIKSLNDKVTRVEVIDEKGRSYVKWEPGIKIELSYQDDHRTLKIFITNG